MYDYNKLQGLAGEQYMSTVLKHEYDCKEKKSRRLTASAHAENMGIGKIVIKIGDKTNWKPIKPDSVSDLVLKEVCGSLTN